MTASFALSAAASLAKILGSVFRFVQSMARPSLKISSPFSWLHTEDEHLAIIQIDLDLTARHKLVEVTKVWLQKDGYAFAKPFERHPTDPAEVFEIDVREVHERLSQKLAYQLDAHEFVCELATSSSKPLPDLKLAPYETRSVSLAFKYETPDPESWISRNGWWLYVRHRGGFVRAKVFSDF